MSSTEHSDIDKLIDGSDEMLQEVRVAIKASLKQRDASRQMLNRVYNKIVAMSRADPRRHRLLNAYERLQRKLITQAALIVDLMGALEREVAEVKAIARRIPT